MYRLRRAMTNADGDTKVSGETVSATWLGANIEKLVTLKWVEPIKRRAQSMQLTTDQTDKESEQPNE